VLSGPEYSSPTRTVVARRQLVGHGIGHGGCRIAQGTDSPAVTVPCNRSTFSGTPSVSDARATKSFNRRSRSRRGNSTRRPHVRHLTPISAPSRTTLQSNPPHGCGFLSRTTSPTANGIGSDFTIGLNPAVPRPAAMRGLPVTSARGCAAPR
jgi:hypothetical protein